MGFLVHKFVPRRRRPSARQRKMIVFTPASCRRQAHAFVTVVALLSITSIAPLWRSSRNLPVTVTSTESARPLYRQNRVEVIFLEGEPFIAKPRTLYRPDVPEFTDVTQTYDYTDSSDHEGKMERRIFPQHENDDKCKPMAKWQSEFYPTCNEFHAFDAPEALSERDFWILSRKGYWRYAWEVVENREKKWTDESWKKYTHNSSIVLRTFKLEHNYEEGYFENNRVDAVAMERLSKSPYVINMYGFCGMSVATEFAGQHVAQVVDKKKPLEKLELAKMIAQGVADIHGIDGDDQASLVHNDLNFANIVIGKNHTRPLINDFNVAVLMMKRNDTQEACPFTSHYPNPQWRAPEEQIDDTGKTSKLLTEKIDIYALGNVMYRFAVGRSPWKQEGGRSLTTEEKIQIANMKRVNGTLPSVPDEVRSSPDPAVQSLLKIMRECYRHQPKLRPTAKEVVNMLQKAIDEYKEKEAAARKRFLQREVQKDRKLKKVNKKKKKKSHHHKHHEEKIKAI